MKDLSVSYRDLVNAFGEAGVVRIEPTAPKLVTVPADALRVLTEIGLPRRVDDIFEASELSEVLHSAHSELLWRFGSDLGTDICLSTRTGEVVSLSPEGAYPERWVNTSLRHFVDFLYRLTIERREFTKLTDDQIDVRVAHLENRMRQLDPRAVAEHENWWSVILEQMKVGLL